MRKTSVKNLKSILREYRRRLFIQPATRRKILAERLRQKVAEDILAVMREQDCSVEMLARRMKVRNAVVREWIWTKDLRLSELSRLLDGLDSEFYPIIRPRKLSERKR